MSDKAKVKLTLSAFAMFVFSAYLSCAELKYTLWGQRADAAIIATQKTQTMQGRRTVQVIGVRYEFTEANGTKREDKLNMPPDWQPPEDRKFRVQYLAGKPGVSRVDGEHEYTAVAICLGLFTVVVGGFILLFRQAYR